MLRLRDTVQFGSNNAMPDKTQMISINKLCFKVLSQIAMER